MQNLHRHSSYSNILLGADSAASNEDYARRAAELGHKILSSVEHGWQGNYFQTYELAKKYNLKPVIGTEAYWVKDRQQEYTIIGKNGKETTAKDKSNHHILLLAKSNMGRESINDILSEANISGYYFRPRIDLPLLLSLPKNDVMVTSACIAFSGYEDIDDIVGQLHDHFQGNFFLEVQYHNTEAQKEWSRHQLELAEKYNIQFIVGLDSHFIYPEETKIRDYLLDAKGIHYEDEEGWYMDYPDNETIRERFMEQGVFLNEQIADAMFNTDIALDFCDYDNVRIFTKDIKLPTLYPDLTKEEKDKKYSQLISKKFKEYMKNIPEEEYQRYFDGVKAEIQTYKDTGMCDYPLLDYAIVKDAVEHGGLITDTGRGSAVGFFTNTLCGFSKVDRFTSAIKLYPERFISTTRILASKSLPDIDLNVGTPEIFEESQKRVLGDNHVTPMIAFGTLKKKSAFKLYARAKNMDFELANKISEQISRYDEAVKNASDEEKDQINIYDFVDEQYKDYIESSQNYWGVISDKKKAPSAYLLYDGDIRREIGLIKCKSEATKKEYITCVIDGMVAENYKFLKNDILKVDVVLLIDKVFKRIGIEHFGVNELINKVSKDQKTWDIYANGYTIGINQVEQDGSRQKCMRYKPHNISELSAFVAAIRPGFKSMYNRFENREDFNWGIPTLDNLLQTEELPVSFIFFQEQLMSVLNYGGFPLDECYGIIKSIAKKHPEKVRPLKQQFIEGFREKLIQDEHLSQNDAQKNAENVWVIINDNCGYGFNSAHAYSMALDSLYQAWQKAHYPYEFYETLLNHYTEKGNKDKVAALKTEMKKAFGITESNYRFGDDNRKFTADQEHHKMMPALTAIKSMGGKLAEELYELGQHEYSSFIDLLTALHEQTSCNKTQISTLIALDYFHAFGSPKSLEQIAEYYNMFATKKELTLSKMEELNIPFSIIERNSSKITEKKAKLIDAMQFIKDLINIIHTEDVTPLEQIKTDYRILGYSNHTIPDAAPDSWMVIWVDPKYHNVIEIYRLYNGETKKTKIVRSKVNIPLVGQEIIRPIEYTERFKKRKVGTDPKTGKVLFEDTDEKEVVLSRYKVIA